MLRKLLFYKTSILLLIPCSFIFFQGLKAYAEELKTEKAEVYNIEERQQPNIKFDDEVYSFGIVEQNEKITHIYNFKNIGEQPLLISGIDWSCGCIEADLSSKEITPGETGWVKVTFDPENRQGKVKMIVSVYSNDPDEPIVTLRIQGYIQTDIIAKPKRLYFGRYDKYEPSTKKLYLAQDKDKKFKVLKVETDSEYITTSIPVKITEEDKDGYQIDVGLNLDVPIGRFYTKLKIHTDSKERPIINVPVTVNVQGDIVVKPTILTFPLSSKKSQAAKTIKIKSNLDEEFKILNVEDNIGYISTKITPLERSKVYQITVEVQPNVPQRNLEGKMTIYTNYVQQPVINIPVYVFNKPSFQSE